MQTDQVDFFLHPQFDTESKAAAKEAGSQIATGLNVSPGAAVGVLGVLAAITFSGGINDAVDNQQRFGLTYELGSFLGGNGFDYAPADQVFAALAADPDVEAVNDGYGDIVFSSTMATRSTLRSTIGMRSRRQW